MKAARAALLLSGLLLGPHAPVDPAHAGASPEAGPATLLADIETLPAAPPAVSPYGFVEWNGVTYFGAGDLPHGFELWRSDGTTGGTYVLADILPGPGGSLPREFTLAGDRLYFTAFDGRHGFGLWSTDGTSEGTRLVKGAEGDFLRPAQLAAYGTTLLFTAGPTDRPALWRSNGTPEGTLEVMTLGLSGESPAFAEPRLPPAVSNGWVWFASRVNGRRALWRTDGSAARTTRFWVDALPQPPDWPHVNADLYAGAHGGLVFRGRDAQGDGLFYSDGTPVGTRVLTRAAPGERLAADWFTHAGRSTFFMAKFDWNGSAFGYREVWRTDGTVAGTRRLASFPAAAQLSASTSRLFVINAGVALTSDLTGRTWTPIDGQYAAALLVPAAGGVLVTGGALRFSDGTATGTVVLGPSPYEWQVPFSLVDRQLHLLATNSRPGCTASTCWFRAAAEGDPPPFFVTRRDRLWRSALTPASTQPLPPVVQRTRGSQPEHFVAYAGDVYFTASSDQNHSPEFPSIPRLVKVTGQDTTVVETFPGDTCWHLGSAAPLCRLDHLAALPGSLLVFEPGSSTWWGTQGDSGERWYARPQLFDPSPRHSVGLINGRVVLVDTTPAGLDLIAFDSKDEVQLGAPLQAVADLGERLYTPVGGWLYFTSASGLWKTDGTPGSVQLVKSVPAAELTDVDGTLFFSSNGALWRSDGSEAGTLQVAPTVSAARLTAVGSRLFFTAFEPARGTELWTSDGTLAGTRRVADVRPGSGSSQPDGLIALGAQVFFSADDGSHGRELWRSDGTPGGTQLVADIQSGPHGSLADGPIAVSAHDRVWFPASTPAHGVELWSSDGSAAGTALVQDIAPGAASSSPQALAAIGARLYFSADDGRHGAEPWSLPLP